MRQNFQAVCICFLTIASLILLYSTAFCDEKKASNGNSVTINRSGFNEIKWGTKLSDISGLKYIGDDTSSHVGQFPKLYIVENESSKLFCNETISSIRYGFNFDKFCKVIVGIRFKGDLNELKKFVDCTTKEFPKFKAEYKMMPEKNGFTPIIILFKQNWVGSGDFWIDGFHLLKADVDSHLIIIFEDISVQKNNS